MRSKEKSVFRVVKRLAAAGDWAGLRSVALAELKNEIGARSKAYKLAQGSFFGLELEVGPKLLKLLKSEKARATKMVLEYTLDLDGVVASAQIYGSSRDKTEEELADLDLFDSPQFEPIVEAIDESGGPEHLVGNLILSVVGSALARHNAASISVTFSHHDVPSEEIVEFCSGIGSPIDYDLDALGIDDIELMTLVAENRNAKALKAKLKARKSLSDLVKGLLDPFLRDKLLCSIKELGESRRLDIALLVELLNDGNHQVVGMLLDQAADSPAAEKVVMKHFLRLLSNPSSTKVVTQPLIESPELGKRFVPNLLSILPKADHFIASTVIDTLFAIDDSAASYGDRLLKIMEGSDLVLGRVVVGALNLKANCGALRKLGEPLLQYLDHPDWFIRQKLLELLAKVQKIPVSLDTISKKLTDSEPKVRIAAGCLIAVRFGVNSKTKDLLRQVMRDSDLVVGNVIAAIVAADKAGLLGKDFEKLRKARNSWLAKRVERALASKS